MISIDKTKIEKPLSILNDKKIGGQLIKFKDEIKIGNTYRNDKVKTALAELYVYYDFEKGIKGIKCAFCESKIDKANTTEEVEHYRPKSGVKIIQLDINGKILRKEENKIDFIELEHKGYYWLCYEWTNLLIACRKCNGHKSTYFPIKDENQRISDNIISEGFLGNNDEFQWKNFRANSDKLKGEKPLLLNPELDTVEDYFTFNADGRIESDKLEGIVSIDIYDLNRKELREARLGMVKKLYEKLEKAVIDFYNYDKPLTIFFDEEIRDLDNPKRAYSRFGYYIKNNFDSFVINRIGKNGNKLIAVFLKMEYEDWKSNQIIK